MNRTSIQLGAKFLCGALLAFGTPLLAQRAKVDLAVGYTEEHANVVGGGTNWLQGGSFELGCDAWHGLGIAMNVTGSHTSALGSQNVSLGLLTTAFGPRYRFNLPTRQGRLHDVSLFAEGLVGEAHGFDGLFPDPAGLNDTALSLETEAGGGVDVSLSHHFAVRPVQAAWVRMQMPNSTTNVQNDLRLTASIVFKIGRKK